MLIMKDVCIIEFNQNKTTAFFNSKILKHVFQKWFPEIPTLPQQSLATLDVEIVDPEIQVKFETMGELKAHDEQTQHLYHLVLKMW